MRAVRWTRRALEDADRIFAFIAQDNPVAASELARAIEERTESLGAFPRMGRVGYDLATREIVVRRHYIVVYRVRRHAIDVLQLRLRQRVHVGVA